MKIVLKIFPQKSHHNATFPLARSLSELGHNVVYNGVEQLRSHVETQGLGYDVANDDFIPYYEAKSSDASITTWRIVSEWYKHRKELTTWRCRFGRGMAFDRLVKTLKPDLVLVDSPFTCLGMSLFRHRIPFGVLESMVNINRTLGFPPLNSSYVPSNGILARAFSEWEWRKYRVSKRWKSGFLPWGSTSFVRDTASAAKVSRCHMRHDRYLHLGLRNIPEFILSPREFDFPVPLEPNQFYVGPSVDMDRNEAVMDYAFTSKFGRCRQEQSAGRGLIYCSLGTASWRYRGIKAFFERLIQAATNAPWNLILSIGDQLDLSHLCPLPANVHVLQTVPQMKVLRSADLMISHGGMNSITECILSGVPLLVLPGTDLIDQEGNASRVVYHKIGLRGILRNESVAQLRQKIAVLLTDGSFKERTRAMRDRIVSSRAFTQGAEVLLEGMAQYFPGRIPVKSNH